MRASTHHLSLASLAAAQAVSAAHASPSTQCCAALAKAPGLQDKVTYPDEDVYDGRLESYWSTSAALPPWCMVLPLTTDEVSATVKVLSENQCPFGIRSGGHSQFHGSSSVNDGVTIDLGYMNSTTLNAEAKTASIGPGSHWRAVYSALAPDNVTVTGGRADIVGVAGFLTGGGYSFYQGLRGFACDNVVNFEVVLGDGSVVHANEGENQDLWRGLRGSSGNLGIVTRFDMSLVEGIDIWGGATFYDMAHKDDIFQAYVDFADNMDNDPASQVILHLPYSAGEFSLKSIMTNAGNIARAPAFDEFLHVDNTSTTTRHTNISDITLENTGNQPVGIYADWFVGLYKNDVRIVHFIHEKHAEIIEKMKAAVPSDTKIETLCQFQALAKSTVEHSEQNGGNVLGLESKVAEGPAQMWLFTMQAYTAAIEAKLIPLAQEFVRAVDDYANSIDSNLDWVYLNYAYKDQDPIGHYGPDALQAIRAASAKYDPEGVFQKLRHSGFKIPA